MKDETRDRRRDLLWGMPVSLIAHAFIAVLLIYGLPRPFQRPQEEQAITVALVPPADEPKPRPAPAPSSKEPEAEKPPEPKIENLPDQNVEKRLRKLSPIEVLKPVFQFGEKDAGLKKSVDGDSADDNSPLPTKDDDPKPAVVPEDAEDKPGGSANSAEPAGSTNVGEKSVGAANDVEPPQDVETEVTSAEDAGKQDADKHEAGAPHADKLTAAAPTPLAAAGGDGGIELPASAEAPKPGPGKAVKHSYAKVSKSGSRSAKRASSKDTAVATTRGYSGLPGVRRIRSPRDTGDATATTSMAGVPRDQRAAKLCASALHQQLVDAAYRPDLVPLVPLKVGNIIDVPDTAFRSTTAWYDLSFRCEVDTNATRVLSFTFRVGNAIPPGEWAHLGLPIVY